jgi:hypothetical protein
MKLVSGKVTYVHRSLWPQVLAVGCARDRWQMNGLPAAAGKLLADVDRAPVEPGRAMRKAASELAARMLAYGAQFHSESVEHVRRGESWRHWSGRMDVSQDGISGAASRTVLEGVLASLNKKFGCKGILPWQGARVVPG